MTYGMGWEGRSLWLTTSLHRKIQPQYDREAVFKLPPQDGQHIELMNCNCIVGRKNRCPKFYQLLISRKWELIVRASQIPSLIPDSDTSKTNSKMTFFGNTSDSRKSAGLWRKNCGVCPGIEYWRLKYSAYAKIYTCDNKINVPTSYNQC